MQEMIARHLRPLVQKKLSSSPAVAIIGPRQCSKTTLSWTFPGKYFDLEQESERLRLDLEWDSLTGARERVILDEAQAWPEVFPRLRGTIDADRKRNGRLFRASIQ